MRLTRQTFGAWIRKPLVIAALFACLVGALGLGQPFDHMYWNVRYYFGQRAAPADVVLVDTTPATGDAHAGANPADDVRLLRALDAAGAREVFLDKPFKDTPEGALARQFAAMGERVQLVVRGSGMNAMNKRRIALPEPGQVAANQIVVSDWFTDLVDYVTGGPTSFAVDGRDYPSFAYALAGAAPGKARYLTPDFRVDPATVKTLSASDLLRDPARGQIEGKRVIVAQDIHATTEVLGYFGQGRRRPVFLDIAGAAAVRNGETLFLGRLPFGAAVWIMLALAAYQSRKRLRYPGYAAASLAALFAPIPLQGWGVNIIPSGAVALVGCYGCLRGWRRWRHRAERTGLSGLPNFLALSDRAVAPGLDVVVASVARYEEFLATLPTALHAEAARQIARRFAISAGGDEVYHGEGGQFAWLQPEFAGDLAAHFEGLRALFATPLTIGGRMFDVNTHFGVDSNSEADTPTRLNMAIASAAEAANAGLVSSRVAARKLIDAPWELSLLARIDEAMKNGDIWLAYQPQWDYRAGRISGAEALIRWDDPVRGAIRPDAFIVQAERAGRIDALTYWVLEEAISALETFNALGPRFQMSINLSAQLVDKPSLISTVSEVVRRRNLDCSLLTVEVTETASLNNRLAAIRNLQMLREMGFKLSIDDYGTGESSLMYLAELPSDELKIDRHFVSRIVAHERERHIVRSTVDLAHALRQTVVAEGIEDQATFELLGRLGCDAGQGYYIGRPETLNQLRDRYLSTSETGGRLFRTC